MGWGSSWEKPKPWGLGVENVVNDAAHQLLINSKGYQEALKDGLEAVQKSVNKHPTHDPYTNPGAFVYYQCECGETFDPHVKSFASLNNHAMNSDWKIRWGSHGYVPYCPKCVVEKGIE